MRFVSILCSNDCISPVSRNQFYYHGSAENCGPLKQYAKVVSGAREQWVAVHWLRTSFRDFQTALQLQYTCWAVRIKPTSTSESATCCHNLTCCCPNDPITSVFRMFLVLLRSSEEQFSAAFPQPGARHGHLIAQHPAVGNCVEGRQGAGLADPAGAAPTFF